jgi:preprotein translocase subunit SecY
LLYALWIVAGTLLLVWLAGVAGAFTVGSEIHLLLVIAVLAVMASLFSRPRVV